MLHFARIALPFPFENKLGHNIEHVWEHLLDVGRSEFGHKKAVCCDSAVHRWPDVCVDVRAIPQLASPFSA